MSRPYFGRRKDFSSGGYRGGGRGGRFNNSDHFRTPSNRMPRPRIPSPIDILRSAQNAATEQENVVQIERDPCLAFGDEFRQRSLKRRQILSKAVSLKTLYYHGVVKTLSKNKCPNSSLDLAMLICWRIASRAFQR